MLGIQQLALIGGLLFAVAMAPFFGVPSGEVWLVRLLKTLINATKIFIGALSWKGFGVLALSTGHTSISAAYYLLTGLGSALGFFVSHVVIMHLTWQEYGSKAYTTDIHGGLMIAIACGVAGTFWGVYVLFTGPLYLALEFVEAFFFAHSLTRI